MMASSNVSGQILEKLRQLEFAYSAEKGLLEDRFQNSKQRLLLDYVASRDAILAEFKTASSDSHIRNLLGDRK